MKTKQIVVQLRIKSYHQVYLNQYVSLVEQKLRENGILNSSQIFLPKKIERFTVLRSPHVDKKARDQFERVTCNRLISFTILQNTSKDHLFLSRLLATLAQKALGVDLRVKYLTKYN